MSRDAVIAAAAALVNQFEAMQKMTPCERYARFKLVIEAAVLAREEFVREEFSNN